MCQLPLSEHADSVARFITDKSDYDNSYHADTVGKIWWVIDDATGYLVFGGKTMDQFNEAYHVWWDEHYPGEVPF